MAAATGLTSFAEDRGLTAGDPKAVRELTPALLRGSRGRVEAIYSGRLSEDLEGSICHHVFAAGGRSRESTIVLCRLAQSVAFVPALVCRDRKTGGGDPAQLPAERWTRTELESTEFNRRYLLLTLVGQDAGLVRELFSPSLIAWLISRPPTGFSWELNEGNLTVSVPGHVTDAEELSHLCGLAASVADRLAAEIDEEEGPDADTFSDDEKLADIEGALGKVDWKEPPESVAAAVSAYRGKARWSLSVHISALMWAAVVLGIGAAIGFALGSLSPLDEGGPIGAVLLGGLAGLIAWPLALLVKSSGHRWGTASVSRVGLEAWVREYAKSRGLKLENRWSFHADHRHLTWPGFADHVLAGRLPGADGMEGRFIMLGNAAEMRSQGVEIAYFSERPMASSAVLVRADRELPESAGQGIELPEDYGLELRGRDVLVWRPIQGNLLRTSAGSDRFCASASAVVERVLAAAGAQAVAARESRT